MIYTKYIYIRVSRINQNTWRRYRRNKKIEHILALLEPQSCLRDKPFKLQVICPQNGTAVLKGLTGRTTKIFVCYLCVFSTAQAIYTTHRCFVSPPRRTPSGIHELDRDVCAGSMSFNVDHLWNKNSNNISPKKKSQGGILFSPLLLLWRCHYVSFLCRTLAPPLSSSGEKKNPEYEPNTYVWVIKS